MRHQLATIAILISIALLVAMHSRAWQPSADNLAPPCQQLIQSNQSPQSVAECLAANDTLTWLEWLSGESRSTQFHFLDFIELVFGDDEHDYRSGDYATPKLHF